MVGAAVSERKQKYRSAFSSLCLPETHHWAIGQNKSHDPAQSQGVRLHSDRSNSKDRGRLLNVVINVISTTLVFLRSVTGEGQSQLGYTFFVEKSIILVTIHRAPQ